MQYQFVDRNLVGLAKNLIDFLVFDQPFKYAEKFTRITHVHCTKMIETSKIVNTYSKGCGSFDASYRFGPYSTIE